MHMIRALVLMMMLAALYSIGILVVLSVEEVPTQNDPRNDNRANACYEGGALEALCPTTDVDGDGIITAIDTDHMWKVGWYYIRYQYRMIPFSVLQERFGWSTIVGTPQSDSVSAPIPAFNSSASSGNQAQQTDWPA